MLTAEQRAQFREQGYVIVPNALQEIGLSRVKQAYERARKSTEMIWRQALADGSYAHKGVYGNGPAAHVMLDVYQHDVLFLELANNPQVIPIIEDVVGPDLQITEMLAHCHPAHTKAHIEWHRDWPPWQHPTQVLKAKVFYYLDDIGPDMGCFSIVPGSHIWSHDPPGSVNSWTMKSATGKDNAQLTAPADYSGSTLENMPHMKKLVGPAGSAVIWNVALWHTATANTSNIDRRVVIYGYSHFWMKLWEDRKPPQQIIEWADTPQKRQLMGIQAVHGRAAWDRQDVPYLPAHKELVETKKF